jgi:hypothetical protein
MRDRIINPIPNLLSIYHLEEIKMTSAFCGSGVTLKIYMEYLERSLKDELRKRRKLKNYFFSEEQRTRHPIQFGRSSSVSSTQSNTSTISPSSTEKFGSKTYS